MWNEAVCGLVSRIWAPPLGCRLREVRWVSSSISRDGLLFAEINQPGLVAVGHDAAKRILEMRNDDPHADAGWVEQPAPRC